MSARGGTAATIGTERSTIDTGHQGLFNERPSLPLVLSLVRYGMTSRGPRAQPSGGGARVLPSPRFLRIALDVLAQKWLESFEPEA